MKRFLPLLLAVAFLSACGDEAIELNVPEVTITFPVNGASVSGIITLSAEASGPVAIARVGFAVDDEVIGSDDSSPYLLQWDTAPFADGGTHTLIAEAEDFDGNFGFSELVVVTIHP